MRIGRGKSPRAIASYSAERDNAVIASTSGRLSRITGTADLMAAPTRAECDRRTSSQPDRRSFWPSDPRSISNRGDSGGAIGSVAAARARVCASRSTTRQARGPTGSRMRSRREVSPRRRRRGVISRYTSEYDPSCASAKRSKKVRILSARVCDVFSRTPSGPSWATRELQLRS